MILSVAKYEGPSGKPFETEGVTPTVVVASNFDEFGDDASDTPTGTNHPSTSAKRSAMQTDDQLNKALEILKGKAA